MAQTKLDIAQTIYNRRVALGMTQKQLADKSGINIVTVCDLECGRHLPRFDTLEMVLEALGLRIVFEEVETDE